MALSKFVVLTIISSIVLVASRNVLAENCRFNVPSSCNCNLTNNVGANLHLKCKDGDLSKFVWTSNNFNQQLVKIEIAGVKTGLSSLIRKLPELPELRELTFENCTSVELPDPSKVHQLRKLSLNSNNLSNEQVAKILDKWTLLPIEEIELDNNRLTVYPSQVLNEMPKLSNVSLRNNEIKILNANHSMKFNVPVKTIDLSFNRISKIDNNTDAVFHGNLQGASLILDRNPIFDQLYNARVLRKMAAIFKTINIGTLNCSRCFVAEIEDFKLIANERITGQCDDEYFVFKDLTREVYKSHCSSSASGSRKFYAVPLFTMVFAFVVAFLLGASNKDL